MRFSLRGYLIDSLGEVDEEEENNQSTRKEEEKIYNGRIGKITSNPAAHPPPGAPPTATTRHAFSAWLTR